MGIAFGVLEMADFHQNRWTCKPSSRSAKAMLPSSIMNGVWAAGVIVGIVSGVLLRMAELSPEQIDMLGFLGELMLRLLKMLVLPLVAGSMVAGNCSMHLWTGPCP